jgi:hypothetical protein
MTISARVKWLLYLNFIGMKRFLCTSLEAPLWRIADQLPIHTRDKLFATDILPHKRATCARDVCG